MATCTSVILNERPTGTPALPVPGRTFRMETTLIPTEKDLKEGQVLYQVYYLSIDPTMLGWMQDKSNYLPPVALGDAMRGITVGKIVASNSPQFQPGDVTSTLAAGWREYAIVDGADMIPTPPGMPMADLVGLFGGTGLTAYFGIDRIAKPKQGDVAVVSAAAGATGTVVGQILKLHGCRVVGIAGGDDKCQWLTEKMGFDVALNYKAPDFRDKFAEATEDGIDIYWDNVRGDVLDLALGQAKLHARFVACGDMSQHGRPDGEQAYKNLGNIVNRRITMQGFITIDYLADAVEAMQKLAAWYSQGKLWTDDKIIKGGLAAAEGALIGLFHGANMGKTLVEIKKPEA